MGAARGGTKEDEVAHEREARMTGAPRGKILQKRIYTRSISEPRDRGHEDGGEFLSGERIRRARGAKSKVKAIVQASGTREKEREGRREEERRFTADIGRTE